MSLVCILWYVYLGMYALVCILFVTLLVELFVTQLVGLFVTLLVEPFVTQLVDFFVTQLVELFVTQLVDLFVTQLVELFVTLVCNPSGKKKLLVRVKCRLRHMCFGRNLLIFYQGELTQGEPNAYSTVIEGCVIFKHYV